MLLSEKDSKKEVKRKLDEIEDFIKRGRDCRDHRYLMIRREMHVLEDIVNGVFGPKSKELKRFYKLRNQIDKCIKGGTK